MKGFTIDVTSAQVEGAKRLMALATLEDIRLIHVRAARMTADGCPVPSMDDAPRPTATAGLLADPCWFRVVVGHVLIGRQEDKAEVQVDGSFELIYSLPEGSDAPSAEELQTFADTNALLNCWPYWRELVKNMVSRMDLPPLVLPLFRLRPSAEGK